MTFTAYYIHMYVNLTLLFSGWLMLSLLLFLVLLLFFLVGFCFI